MLGNVRRSAHAVAALTILCSALASAQSPAGGEAMPHHGHPETAPSSSERAGTVQAADADPASVNVLLKSDEARVPMQDPNRGIPMAGDTMADDGVFHLFLLDRLEYIKAPGQNGFAWDAQGWIGGDLNRLWLKSQGTRMGGETEDASAEVLWAHAFAAFWDWQAGVRRDFGAGPGRTWAAFGVQGLAPYWFDVEATAYVSSAGRLAARAKATYDIRFSQRVVLTPEVEANLYAKDDPARSIGSGLSDVRLGARLRYEVQRNVAPYIGVSWGKRLGKSADYARAAGRGTTDKQVVVGLRMWF